VRLLITMPATAAGSMGWGWLAGVVEMDVGVEVGLVGIGVGVLVVVLVLEFAALIVFMTVSKGGWDQRDGYLPLVVQGS
jgi:hypothetical protein